jgi:group I intron endonuclease
MEAIERTTSEPGIYRIDIGENFYFGSAICLRKRRWSHIKDLRAGNHGNDRMQKAYNKHKIFSFTVMEEIPDGENFKERLLSAEQSYIDAGFNHPRCMNLSPTAGNCIGVKHTKEAKKRMSEATKKRCIFGILHPRYGSTHTPEARQKISDTHKGRVWGQESIDARKAGFTAEKRAAMARKKTGSKQSTETIEKRMVKIRGAKNSRAKRFFLDIPNIGRREFGCSKEASSLLGISRTSLSPWLSGKKPWPGEGGRTWNRTRHLMGLKGAYIQ